MFETCSVDSELEARTIALNLKENFKNIFKIYEGSEHAGFDDSIKTMAQIECLVVSAENAYKWIDHNIHPADRRNEKYCSAIDDGLSYLGKNLPKELDNRLLNTSRGGRSQHILANYVERDGEMHDE
ncbi:MAG: hypothetical protein NT016_00075 [Candidatus Aenigmarchaeota archaeon]|nr:hypothetical protein [Candidatus Aenigmarchaeota archaeon]